MQRRDDRRRHDDRPVGHAEHHPGADVTYVLQGTSTAQPHAAGCAIASGTAITVTALAPNVTVKLYAFSISLPLTSSLTVVEQ